MHSTPFAPVYRHPARDAIVRRGSGKSGRPAMKPMPVALAVIGCAKLILALALLAGAASPAAAGRATLNLVLVLDGLRPDAITPDETPNLWRLRQEGIY